MTEWHGYPHAAAPAHEDAAPSFVARVGMVVNWAGALLSVALLVGVGIWSYRLMVRDISGVPVVRALDGPMRISPEDPGGRQAAYQGLAVNAVAAGASATPVEAVALAPGPVELAEEDRPLAAIRETSSAPAVLASLPAPEAPTLALEGSTEPAPAPTRGEGPTDLAVLPADVPGLSRSPFPAARPAGPARFAMARGNGNSVSDADDAEAEALLELLIARLAPGAHTEIDPETLPVGTRLVQLGAFPDEVGAREAWDTLAGRFAAAFDGRARVIEPAVSAGRTIYRLRAHGFADEPEARRFCALLVAEGADCIPVLIR